MKEFIIAVVGLNIGCGVGFLLGRIGIAKIKEEVKEAVDKIEKKIDEIRS